MRGRVRKNSAGKNATKKERNSHNKMKYSIWVSKRFEMSYVFPTELQIRDMAAYSSTEQRAIFANERNRACKWNRKRSPFMSAKLSFGDIIATEMHASDDTSMNISLN